MASLASGGLSSAPPLAASGRSKFRFPSDIGVFAKGHIELPLLQGSLSVSAKGRDPGGPSPERRSGPGLP